MKKMDFNREWYVKKENESAERLVHLPHDAMIYESRDKKANTNAAGAYFFGGKYIYKKRFHVPEEWEESVVIMECEGVYHNAKVFLNDKLLAERPYGYSNFYIRLDQGLRMGTENEIVVIADNEKTPNSRWYSGSGIFRKVNLYVGSFESPAPEGIRVTVLNKEQIRVDVESAAEFCEREFTAGEDGDYQFFPASGDKKCVYTIEILDQETVVGKAEGNHVIIDIPKAKLWDAEHPYLYHCRVCQSGSGAVKNRGNESQWESAESAFGMRVIDWRHGSFKINGKETKLKGACIHHDNGILGAAAFADAEYRRVRILKEAGFNAIRCSHNPMSKEMLEACDTLGMYVMDEAFDMWLIHKNPYDYAGETFKTWWKRDMGAMISKDYNHPSVVMYSIGNEISDLGLEEGLRYCEKIAAFVRKADAGRPVTSGVNLLLASMTADKAAKENKGGKKKEEKVATAPTAENQPTSIFFNFLMNKMGNLMNRMASSSGATKIARQVNPLLDIAGYNYATSRYKKDCEQYPDRLFVGSETLPKYLYQNWSMVKSYKNLIGDFMWTGWDYLGEAGIGTVTYKKNAKGPSVEAGLPLLAGCGVIDICGNPRAEVGWNKSIWGMSDQPVIGVEPVTHANHVRAVSMWRNTDAVESWSWEGCENMATQVVVYTDAAKIRLMQNGKTIGTKAVKENKALFKKVVYKPGVIEAVALDASGRELSRSSLVSATGKTRIKLKPDRDRLSANGQDLCFIEVSLVGDHDVVKASCDREIKVTAEGAGSLQGFGSAKTSSDENFYSGCYKTHYGRALAVIRAGYEEGDIVVCVSGEGVETQRLKLSVVKEKSF